MSESNAQSIRIFALYAGFAALLALGIHTLVPWVRLTSAHDGQIHTIETVADFERMLTQDHAALFVDADWSMTTAIMRPVFADYARSPTGWRAPKRFYRLDVSLGSDVALINRSQRWMDLQRLPDYGVKTYRRAGMVIWTQRGNVTKYVQTHCWPESPVVRFHMALTHWSEVATFYLLAALLLPALGAACRLRWRFSLRSLAVSIAVLALGCLVLDPHRSPAMRALIHDPRLWWYVYGDTITTLFVVSSLATILYFVGRWIRSRFAPRLNKDFSRELNP